MYELKISFVIDTKISFRDSVVCLRCYILPMANVLNERNRFYQRCLEKGETFDQFLSDLYRLAENCEFDSQKDQMIRDRIVFGISNCDLQMELLKLGGNPTLNDIIAMCRLSLNQKPSTDYYLDSGSSLSADNDISLWENNYLFSDEDIILLTGEMEYLYIFFLFIEIPWLNGIVCVIA